MEDGLQMVLSLGQVAIFIPKAPDIILSVDCYTILTEVFEDTLKIDVDNDRTENIYVTLTKGF
jgi:hypothetical protein